MVLSSHFTCENGLKVAIKPCYDSNQLLPISPVLSPYSYSYSSDVTQHWQRVL